MTRPFITKTVPSIFGLNVGQNIGNGDVWDLTKATNDADYHAKIGVQHVRIATPGYYYTNGTLTGDNAALAHIHTMVQLYLARGIEVQYVLNYGYGVFGPSHSTQVTNYQAYVTQEAAWAQSVGVQRLQLENEVEIAVNDGSSEATIYTYLQTLPAFARAAGFTGKLTYSVSQDHYASWIANGLGSYDDLGGDIYGNSGGSFTNFKSQVDTLFAAFGANFYLSELAVNAGAGDLYTLDPYTYSANMILRRDYVAQKIPSRASYTFCWKFTNGPRDSWGAKTLTDEFRLWWFDYISQRQILTY